MEIEQIIKNINLSNIPSEYKLWRYLQDYRNDWDFLSYSLRYRVAEQNMACDYLASLEKWLKPVLTIRDRQKIILVQLLATIYEAVLGDIIDNKIKEEKARNKLFEATFYYDKYDSNSRTFGLTLKIAYKLNIINDTWSSYLGKIREIRNWLHLSNDLKGPLMAWLRGESCEGLCKKLGEFRNYIK